jgi:CheY-like chemotaxis protein
VNQLVLVEMLRLFGVSSSTAATGAEAAALFEQSLRPESPLSFDVIFMDWHMPDMDGLKATLVMRTLEQAQPHRQRTPIIAVTASAMPGDRDACLAAGMDDYLAKPCALGELETLLDRWCPESRREGLHATDL